MSDDFRYVIIDRPPVICPHCIGFATEHASGVVYVYCRHRLSGLISVGGAEPEIMQNTTWPAFREKLSMTIARLQVDLERERELWGATLH